MQIENIPRYHYIHVTAKTKNTGPTKYWQRCRGTETVLHCWWVCKRLQPLWKTMWQLLRMLNKHSHMMKPLHSLVFIQEKGNICPYKDSYVSIHSDFTWIAPNWKEGKCPSTGEQILVYPCNGTSVSNERGWTINMSGNIHELQNNYAE